MGSKLSSLSDSIMSDGVMNHNGKEEDWLGGKRRHFAWLVELQSRKDSQIERPGQRWR
jgi:hypothetical protein